jgi:hypothetical protein
MRKGFLIYEEMRKFSPYMRRPLVIFDFAPDLSEFPYIPSNAHISTPFFRKQCFSLKNVLGTPPQNVWRYV